MRLLGTQLGRSDTRHVCLPTLSVIETTVVCSCYFSHLQQICILEGTAARKQIPWITRKRLAKEMSCRFVLTDNSFVHLHDIIFLCVLIAPTVYRQQQSIKTGTAGDDQSLAPMYYRNANCAVVVYDITQSVRAKNDMFCRRAL